MQESVTQTVKDEVLQRIDALGEKLGVAAGQLWEVLVAQHAVVNGIYFSATGLVFLVVGLVSMVLFFGSLKTGEENRKTMKDHYDNKYYRWRAVDVTRTAICSVLAILGLVAGLFTTLFNVPHLINPEYYALQDILRVF